MRFNALFTYSSVLLLSLAAALAPLQASAVQVGSQDAIDEVFFEKEMEARLTRDIRSYLGHDRFIIGVDFKVNGSQAPGGEDNVVVREITTPLPGLPQTTETFVKELTPDELTNLRENLLLDDQVGSRAGLIDNQASNAFTGSGTEVYLVLDTTVNSVQENFIRDLIGRKLGLDVGGGDGIQVVRSDFSVGVPSGVQGGIAPQVEQQRAPAVNQQAPQFQPIPFPVQQPFNQPQQQQQAPLETEEERTEKFEEVIRDAANAAAQAVTDANAASAAAAAAGGGGEGNEFLERYWWAILLAVLLFFLFIIFLAFIMTRRSSSYPQMQYPMQAPLPATAGGTAPAASSEGNEEAQAASGLGEVRREIAAVGLASPNAVRSEMDSLMVQNRLDLVAPAYRILGHNLFESVFGEVPSALQSEINEYLTDRDISDGQIEAQGRDLYARLLRTANDDESGSRSQAFRFLDKLHPSQVLSLIKNEKTRVQALVVSQLQPAKATEILQALDGKQRSEIVHELSQFETFPVETFRDVASLLAKKAHSLPVVENITTDGISILMGLLDNMSTVEESKMLGELENKNPELFIKLKKQYFTFADLARAPQKIMGEALLDIDKDIIARAMMGANDGILRRVLGSLPKRLADSVKEEMTLLKGKVNSEQIQADRKAVLGIMRGLVRDDKINMEKL